MGIHRQINDGKTERERESYIMLHGVTERDWAVREK